MKKTKEVQTRTLNIRVPAELIDWVDSLVENKIYNSRSEVIRNLIRDYLKK